MRRGFQGFKAKTIVRWLTAGKAVTARSLAKNTDIGRDGARRIVKGVMAQESSIDRRQLGADILLLARAPDGVQQLEQALASSGNHEVPLMVRALIYHVMADLACRADLFPRQAGVWSVFCLTALWAGAAILLAGVDLDPSLRLMWLAGLAVAFSSVGLIITGLAALRRRNVLAEVELIRALVVVFESFSGNPAGGSV